jgi:hypothetical protein
LSTQKAAIADALAAKRPADHHPDEIVAMLDAVPDLRPTIETATEEELAEIFRTFDVRITYDKSRQALNFAATITSEHAAGSLSNTSVRYLGFGRIFDCLAAGQRIWSPSMFAAHVATFKDGVSLPATDNHSVN